MNRSSLLPARDVERLSTYLDDALPAREKALLESRLAQEPELREALDELRSVRAALRGLPARAVPRNFTLAAEAVPARRGAPYPGLSLATALATVAFLVVFGWDALGRGFALGAQAPLSEPLAAGAPEGQSLEVAPSIAQETDSSDTVLRSAAPTATLIPPSAFANGMAQSATLTPTPTPTPVPPEFGAGGSAPDAMDSLKIGLGVLALGLGTATVLLRRKRS